MQAIDADPRDAMLHFSLGNAYITEGNTADALKEFKRCTELDKKEAKYNVEYGRLVIVSFTGK